MRISHLSAVLSVSACLNAPVVAQEPEAPLSVIDWLDTMTAAPAQVIEPPVTATGRVPSVAVSALDANEARVTGLVPKDVTGLPESLWQESRVEEVRLGLQEAGVPQIPALQALLYSLVLTEALPPVGAVQAFQLARIEALEAHGALEPALALTQSLEDGRDPAVFSKLFDLSLIAGTEDQICTRMQATPALAPDKASEIFCQARGGDWQTATLLFGTADALSLLEPAKADALARFLDPDLFEGEAALPEPQAPDALMFRLYEALGQRLPTQGLPRVFAHADLSDTAGWKSQLEAAERLAATGAIPDNRLLGLYSDRRPAASGGIWDRVQAIQQFETALNTGSAEAVSKTLPGAWAAAQAGGFATRFAGLFSEALQGVTLSGRAADLAFHVALLSPDYAQAPLAYPVRARAAPVLTGIAVGETAGLRGLSALETAVLEGFAQVADRGAAPLGTSLLRTIADVEAGAAGDLGRLSRGLAHLRAAGLKETAQRAALQVLLLRGAS